MTRGKEMPEPLPRRHHGVVMAGDQCGCAAVGSSLGGDAARREALEAAMRNAVRIGAKVSGLSWKFDDLGSPGVYTGGSLAVLGHIKTGTRSAFRVL